MKCQKCQAEVHAGKFCVECGTQAPLPQEVQPDGKNSQVGDIGYNEGGISIVHNYYQQNPKSNDNILHSTKHSFSDYEDAMRAVIKIVGDAGGRLDMIDVFDRLGQLPANINGKNLAWKLGRESGYLEPYSKVGRNKWVLSEKGLQVYRKL